MTRSPLDKALDRAAYATDGDCPAGRVPSVAGLSRQSRAVELRLARKRIGVAPTHPGTVRALACGCTWWVPAGEDWSSRPCVGHAGEMP